MLVRRFQFHSDFGAVTADVSLADSAVSVFPAVDGAAVFAAAAITADPPSIKIERRTNFFVRLFL